MHPTITIRRQKVSCYIGVPDEERAAPQTLEITTRFPVSGFLQAAQADDIQSSIDYQKIYEVIHEVAGERPRKLIETLAQDLESELRERFQLAWVDIEIRKFILPETESVVLEYRGRPE